MQTTRRTLLSGIGASLALAATAPALHAQPADAMTQGWDRLQLLDAQDRPFSLAQSNQKLTLVMLWAHWCGICLRELDTVSAITPQIGVDRLRILLVSHPDDWERNQAMARQRGITLPCARVSPDNPESALQRALMSADGTFYVPRGLLFSRASQSIVWSHVGGLDWRRAGALAPILDHAA